MKTTMSDEMQNEFLKIEPLLNKLEQLRGQQEDIAKAIQDTNKHVQAYLQRLKKLSPLVTGGTAFFRTPSGNIFSANIYGISRATVYEVKEKKIKVAPEQKSA